jgi:hypothetical protein
MASLAPYLAEIEVPLHQFSGEKKCVPLSKNPKRTLTKVHRNPSESRRRV